MRLKHLLKSVETYLCKSKLNPEITGITSFSKEVKPGNLYVAITGKTHDGKKFIPEALALGASAILTDLYNPLLEAKAVQVQVKDPRRIGQMLACQFYRRPEHLIGVTGTSGKTTVSFLVQELLNALGYKTGLIGTVYVDTLIHKQEAVLTTPDGIAFSRALNETVMGQGSALVAEISSHALDQERVLGHTFETVVYTNLSHDHRDYHPTLKHYLDSKHRLFEKPYLPQTGGRAVVNLDDAHADFFLDTPRTLLTYSLENPKATLYLKLRPSTLEGLEGTLYYNQETYLLTSRLMGRFNASNLLAAIGVALGFEPSLKKILEALKGLKGAPGRLEKIGSNVFIDYAHKPDALEKVLLCLKELPYKKIKVLFGCGGNRDKTKRPIMGTLAEKLSDQVILTSDNPRDEDPLQILEEIKSGIQDVSKIQIIADRKEAIIQALKNLEPDECLLIAGKGHEKTQTIGTQKLPFDDKKVVEEAIKG